MAQRLLILQRRNIAQRTTLVQLTEQAASNLTRTGLRDIGNRHNILRLSNRADVLTHVRGQRRLQLILSQVLTLIGERYVGDRLVTGQLILTGQTPASTTAG